MNLMERQRAMRLAKEARDEEARLRALGPAGFFDRVNTSAGLDECHPWTGSTRWNHPAGDPSRFEYGTFEYEGCDSDHATRVVCLLTFGRLVPPEMDVMPLCDNHMCVNVRHLCITPHGGDKESRLAKAVPAEEFFCEPGTQRAA